MKLSSIQLPMMLQEEWLLKIVAAHAIKLCLKGDSQEVIITGVSQFASCSAKESEALSFPALIEDEDHTKAILLPE